MKDLFLAFLDVLYDIFLIVAMFVVWLLSLDPYASPEINFSFLIFAILIFTYFVWRFMTRNDNVKFWQIF